MGPTHGDGGIIDHVYLYRPYMYKEVVINWALFAPFYSDHFGISIIIQKKEWVRLKMKSTFPDIFGDNSNVSNTTVREEKDDRSLTTRKRSATSSSKGRKNLRKQ